MTTSLSSRHSAHFHAAGTLAAAPAETVRRARGRSAGPDSRSETPGLDRLGRTDAQGVLGPCGQVGRQAYARVRVPAAGLAPLRGDTGPAGTFIRVSGPGPVKGASA